MGKAGTNVVLDWGSGFLLNRLITGCGRLKSLYFDSLTEISFKWFHKQTCYSSLQSKSREAS